MGLAHWDDVEQHRRAKGEMDATWQRLGDAAGTKGVGLNRVRVAPGKLPTPPHSHGASEEVYYVLEGSGLAWQDDQVHEVRPGDCVIHRANELEHTFVAGPDGLDYLVFGTRHPTELGWLPRSGAVRFGWPWVEGRTDDPWDREAEAPPLAYGEPAERPPNILNVDEVELERWGAATTAPLATKERSDQAGFHWERLDPGGGARCRTATPRRRRSSSSSRARGRSTSGRRPRSRQGRGAEQEEIPIRAGHVIARPPGDTRQPLVPRRPERADDARSTARASRTTCALYPALEQDRLARARRDRPDRVLDYDDGEPDDDGTD